jgi:8-oxo-dGTP diphosphatase
VLTVPVIVVAAAILDGARLLAARRLEPAALAGGWELPGGKVEPGEDDLAALVRECREELGVVITPGRRLGEHWPMSRDALLRVWTATVAEGTPQALDDHSEVRWLEPGQWYDVAWLPSDLQVVRALEQELGESPTWPDRGVLP